VVDDLDRVAVALVRRRCGGHPTNPPRSPTLTNVTVPFPRIPGFFIVTSVYMLAEKASDVILEDARR